MLWVFVQPENMMNAIIRKNEKIVVFFIKESLPVIMESKCTSYLNIPIPLLKTDKYISMGISGTAWKTNLTPFQFYTEQND